MTSPEVFKVTWVGQERRVESTLFPTHLTTEPSRTGTKGANQSLLKSLVQVQEPGRPVDFPFSEEVESDF